MTSKHDRTLERWYVIRIPRNADPTTMPRTTFRDGSWYTGPSAADTLTGTWEADQRFRQQSSSTVSPPSTMRGPHPFEKVVEEMKPSKSDINWVIMDYLVSEGYPGAAEKFAQETNVCRPADLESIRERVRIRSSIHAGSIQEAIELINEIDPEILDSNHHLHFRLLQLQLIEMIRSILSSNTPPQVSAFRPALEFATSQLSPRAPTDQKYQKALEYTMALMIFDKDKMTPEFKELLDVRLREKVASDVNKAILESKGQHAEARIRQLVRARAWAEVQAREAKVDLPATIPIGLDAEDEAATNGGGEPMIT